MLFSGIIIPFVNLLIFNIILKLSAFIIIYFLFVYFGKIMLAKNSSLVYNFLYNVNSNPSGAFLMTEYRDFQQQPISELTSSEAFYAYLEQAAANLNAETTFLPITKLWNFSFEFDRALSDEKKRMVFTQTLRETFKRNDVEVSSRLIFLLGRKGSERQDDEKRELVAQLAEEMTPENLNKLDTSAKLTLADVWTDKGKISLLDNLYFEEPLQLSDKEKSDADNASRTLLENFLSRKSKNSSFSLPWSLQVAALEASLQTYGSVNTSLPCFINLLQESNSGNGDKEKRIDQLIGLTEQFSKNFDFIHNKRSSNYDTLPKNWPALLPTEKNTSKLIYDCLYVMKFFESPVSGPNASLYQQAHEEVQAQRLLDRFERFGSPNVLVERDISLLLKYRPQEFLSDKNLSFQLKRELLPQKQLPISDEKRLKLMASLLMDAKSSGHPIFDNEIYHLLKMAAQMKTVSPAMKNFIAAVTPIVEERKRNYDQAVAKIEDAEKKRRKMNEAHGQVKKIREADRAFSSLVACLRDIDKLKSDKELYLQPEQIERIVRNAIADREPKQFEVGGKSFSDIFKGKKERQRQEQLRQSLIKLNTVLADLPQHKKIFDQISHPLNKDTYHGEFMDLHRQLSREKLESENLYNAARDPIAEHIKNDYEEWRPQELLENIKAGYEQRKEELRAKARLSLALRFKGQEFGGKSPLTQSDELAKDIYLAKVRELEKKIRKKVKEDMVERGVYETPDREDPNKNGKKISPNSETIQVIKLKKEYEKLAKD